MIALGSIAHEVDRALAEVRAASIERRIWERDASVWTSDPDAQAAIGSRLGWLDLPSAMAPRLPEITTFADAIRSEGVKDVVLLGMGGSSLAPLVFSSTMGKGGRGDGEPAPYLIGGSGRPWSAHDPPNPPALTVLDSTDPRLVRQVTEAVAVNPARTIYIVASKSGTTIEPNELCRHFRRLAGADRFVAITDPGTELATRARSDGWRALFENPSDIGGRYSALSLFGLVPAALAGIDVARVLARAKATARPDPYSTTEGGAAWLGCVLGAAARAGRDKATFVCPPPFADFGLWAEQLLAESTGKNGTGIVPVAGEPLGPTKSYGNDRLFVALRVRGDGVGAELAMIAQAGHPVVSIPMSDPYDVGREMWRFEMATAVAGHLLGINPFDEPNVAEAKAATATILEDPSTPELPADGLAEVVDLLGQVRTGDYFAVLVYGPYSDAIETAATELRTRVRARTGVATTFGYGPRYLHSTGQLHKGGRDNGVFLMVTMPSPAAADIGQEVDFARLQMAQAAGDFATLAKHGLRAVHVSVSSADELVALVPAN